MKGAPPLCCAFAFMAREGVRAMERIGRLEGHGLGFEFWVLLNSGRDVPSDK